MAHTSRVRRVAVGAVTEQQRAHGAAGRRRARRALQRPSARVLLCALQLAQRGLLAERAVLDLV